ncbi:hypothetical protein HDU82_008052 [Entophlyctis luteolus]|nr:hypothetical protein HDU82_008052 [Entophlyctis luteolus]
MSSIASNSSNIFQRFEIVGRGSNVRHSDGAIVVDAGWDTDSTLDCAVMIQITSKLNNVRIQAEFRGYIETRWEGLTTLAQKYESTDYHVTTTGRVFQQLVQVVYESSEPFKLLKTNVEIEVPVEVSMPESAKLRFLRSPSHLTHVMEATEGKIGCTVGIPRRFVAIGDTLEVNVLVQSTPPGTSLRTMIASLRPMIHYLSNGQHLSQARGAQAIIPRPLSEVVESFPMVAIREEYGSEAILRQFYLHVDPALAQPSFEAPLISCKTILRIQLTLDNSETPNISYEVPIVVLRPPKVEQLPALVAAPLHRSKSQAIRRGRTVQSQSTKVVTRPPRSESMSANTRALDLSERSATGSAVTKRSDLIYPQRRLQGESVGRSEDYGGMRTVYEQFRAPTAQLVSAFEAGHGLIYSDIEE